MHCGIVLKSPILFKNVEIQLEYMCKLFTGTVCICMKPHVSSTSEPLSGFIVMVEVYLDVDFFIYINNQI